MQQNFWIWFVVFFFFGFIVSHTERATIAVTLVMPKSLFIYFSLGACSPTIWVRLWRDHAFNFKFQRPMWYLMHAIQLSQWTVSGLQALIDETYVTLPFVKAAKKKERPPNWMIIHFPPERGVLHHNFYMTSDYS